MKSVFFTAVVLATSLGACATSDRYGSSYGNDSYRNTGGVCYDCGTVVAISSYTGERRGSGAGALAGALVGGALGNQVGSGDGKKAATIAGAVAGGFAGNAIEKNMNDTWYDVTVRMNDGRQLMVTQNKLDGIREGSRVLVRNGRVELN